GHEERRDRFDRESDAEIGRAPNQIERRESGKDCEFTRSRHATALWHSTRSGSRLSKLEGVSVKRHIGRWRLTQTPYNYVMRIIRTNIQLAARPSNHSIQEQKQHRADDRHDPMGGIV